MRTRLEALVDQVDTSLAAANQAREVALPLCRRVIRLAGTAIKSVHRLEPEAAVARIVEGRLGGFFKEIVQLEQESVTESKKSVKQVLDEAGTTVTRFARFEVGA